MKCLEALLTACLSVCLMGGLGCGEAKEDAPPAKSEAEKYVTLDLGGGVSMELVLIPAGEFTMGSPTTEDGREDDESPERPVTLSEPFYMGVHEVTQEQYEAVIGKNPAHFKGAKRPVEKVSWSDAMEFCRKLSATTGMMVGLPTEAEWEYACRAGTTTPFHTGRTISTDQANYDGDHTYGDGKKGEDRGKTLAVGSFRPNGWGLYDMHGNVWEWCSDWYGDSYAHALDQDPTGPESGTLRVLRGGGWGHNPQNCRSASRHWYAPGFRSLNYGFRVAVDPE